jgi:radical SAM enzyme (TIGR01210 family)
MGQMAELRQSREVAIDAAEPALRRACELTLTTHAIDHRDVLATFVVGSRANGSYGAENDTDLILFVREHSSHPEFSYRRLDSGSEKVHANVLKTSFLNELCQSDVGWAYRLHGARFVREFTAIPEIFFARWMVRIERLVESAAAFRYRLIRHIHDCRQILRGAEQFDLNEPEIAKYLMIEAVFILPTIYLNHCGIVPFQHDIPWNEALRVADANDASMGKNYKRLIATIVDSEFFRNLNRDRSFALELKHVRDECRMIIVRHLGNVFRNGYGAVLGNALSCSTDLKREVLRFAGAQSEAYGPVIDVFWDWLNLAREGQRAGKLTTGAKLKVRRKKNRTFGTRYVYYEQGALRLKAIIPTGGCRVPTCSFCMLPSLARSKASVAEAIADIERTCQKRPVRQLTIYTDGSFFDERELDRGERLVIAETARRLEVEELLVESLPRFVNEVAVDEFVGSLGPKCALRLGVGVQSTDNTVRQHVTRTPITQNELRTLLEWRKRAPFTMRLYLLANKPLLSQAEDRRDLHRSLQFLDEYLTDRDIVTINPLLLTNGTMLEKIWEKEFWRPLRVDEVKDLDMSLRSKNHAFRIEFGPASDSTCTDVDGKSHGSTGFCDAEHHLQSGNAAMFDAAFLPWSILGSMRHRGHWAARGGFSFHDRGVT